MTLYDDEGHEIGGIHMNLEPQVTEEGLARRRHGLPTSMLLGDMEHLYVCLNFVQYEQFMVEWLPNTCDVLMAKLIKEGQPQPTGRHRHALVKFLARLVVMETDRKLRAWATLAGKGRLREEHVLENVGGFDVVFKVVAECIQVLELRASRQLAKSAQTP